MHHRLLLLILCGIVTALGAARPNILWISCEDIGPHLGCYGDEQATTPHLDQLAAQGVRFDRAFSVTGVCATCRASIITGMYASTLGNQFMRCAIDLPEHIELFPQYLRDAGYYCTNNSKTDYNITGSHARCWDESSRRAHWRNRPDPDQPFFAVFNLTNTHESQVFDYQRPANLRDSQLHDPNRMAVPPYHPDTPITRADWAHYLDNITSMDQLAADRLAELDADGLANDTFVFFWSDHGAGLPRAKRWIYDSGTHVPMIVRIPERFRQAGQGVPGSVSQQLVSLLDLPPTILNLAGISVPEHFQGQAFLGERLPPERQYVFTIRDRMDERYDMMRGVRDKRFKYIRNYQPDKPYFQVINYMEQEHTMRELRRLHALSELTPTAAQFMAAHKPFEELYDLQSDPHEVHNLIDHVADQTDLQVELDRLRAAHHRWIIETRDTGLIPEPELEVRGQRLGTRFDILRQPGADELLERLIEVHRLACDPQSAEADLVLASQDDDAAVRFWALAGLGNAPGDSDATRVAIQQGLADDSGSVRMAAARAVWKTGQSAAALPIVRQAAMSGDEFLSLMAIHLIDEMNEQAEPIRDVVDWVKTNQPGYPARVAEYLLGSQR
jgi:arylsulfatase A-like enzyme